MAAESPFHPLSTLALMSNHDKHWRLPITVYGRTSCLGSDEPSKNRWLPGDGRFKHGSIVGYMIGDVDVQVINEFQLVLGDPFPPELRSNHEIVTAARKWHQATDTATQQVISA